MTKTTRVSKADAPRVRLGGEWYVIVRESEFRRLCQAAGERGASQDLTELGLLADLSPLAAADGSLGKRLVDRRRLAGLTQKDLAERAGIRVETLNRIEHGRTTPDFATVRKLVVSLKAALEKR
jgi:DNA-binding XRE family transcriptional regulator